MSVTFHYCCGKFDNISFSQNEKKDCLPGKQVSKQKCCDNKKLEFKLKADQEKTVKQLTLNCIQPAFVSPRYYVNILPVSEKPVNELPTGPPLITSSVSLCIQNCVFRI